MITSKHTPEPWNIHPHYKCEGMAVENEHGEGWVAWSAVIGKGEMIIADVKGCTHDGGFSKVENGKEVQANADRIIACVNACAGINPEAVPDLLAAAKGIIKAIEDGNGVVCYRAMMAAIAKAEGRAE